MCQCTSSCCPAVASVTVPVSRWAECVVVVGVVVVVGGGVAGVGRHVAGEGEGGRLAPPLAPRTQPSLALPPAAWSEIWWIFWILWLLTRAPNITSKMMAIASTDILYHGIIVYTFNVSIGDKKTRYWLTVESSSWLVFYWCRVVTIRHEDAARMLARNILFYEIYISWEL